MFIILFGWNDVVTFRYGEALHGGELVAAGGVLDLPLFITLFGRNDGVTFRYGEALHGRELVAASCICDLEGAHGLVAADHFPEIQ